MTILPVMSNQAGGPDRSGWQGRLTLALEQAIAAVRRQALGFGAHFPDDCADGGRYNLRRPGCGQSAGSNIGWTTGFRTGQLWLAAELTGEADFERAARLDVANFVERLRLGIDIDTHDLGFLYVPTCVAAWHLTGDTAARTAALSAAEALLGRVIEPAGIVQAWGDLDDPHQRGRTIIDSAMNMPLLYWASAQTGDQRYAEAALRHMAQLRDHIFRDDDSTFHTFYWDPDSGAPLRGATQQGHSDASCWARGQVWGIYGFALTARLSGQASFLQAAQRCARYYLEHLPADRVPYWDLVFTDDGAGQPRDASAAVIAACGLIELADLVADEAERQSYLDEVTAVMTTLTDAYTPAPSSDSNVLLLHGVYDLPKQIGVDEANLWGDYFYLETLMRLINPAWQPYWRLLAEGTA